MLTGNWKLVVEEKALIQFFFLEKKKRQSITKFQRFIEDQCN